ncbi:helix-turn-helix domain-containing protein [Enterococcus dispar]|uniref:helix-turn-helix domain-containing protein n=1 Tax=Enterococcus dispar TaxID=44009 RepID=UPI0021D405A9|nr:helix-turn-helix transcriptional regulator [Enterococcus dispar]MCU7356736.1 helix-turn-helix domain-containing protein [Enterococcus dispar]
MSILSKIKDLSQENHISLAELERRTGLSSGSITKWSKSAPSADKLRVIADYFHVSTDYLLGRTENKYAGLSDEQRKMTIEEALKSAMGKDGKEIAEEDIPVLERIIEAFLNEK